MWHTPFLWPFQQNESVRDHPSIPSGLAASSVPQRNAGSCKRREKRVGEVGGEGAAKGKLVAGVQRVPGVWGGEGAAAAMTSQMWAIKSAGVP